MLSTPPASTSSHSPLAIALAPIAVASRPAVLLQSGPTVTYELGSATSLSGPIGTPATTDHAIVVDYTIELSSNCRSATGSLEGTGAV